MARCWTGGSCACRWPDTAGRPTPTTEAAAEEEGGGEASLGGTGDTAAEAGALPPARDTGDAADPAAGVALAPEADPATADPGPGPTPDPSPTLRGTRRPRPSPRPDPDRDPGPGPGPSLGPEAAPLPPKEDPGPDLKASPSQQQRMEESPRSAEHISNSFQVKT